ncbi:MAG TPA: AAA family ATPase [Gemmataceae bacterium]|nr:AAA family ATPase [Gemmataceae bacterium]
MSIVIAEKELPKDLTVDQAVELAYTAELAEAASKLQRGLPTLIECDKDLAPFLFVNLRNRLKTHGFRCSYLDGRQEQQEGGMPMGLIGTMIVQVREAVRGAVEFEKRVVALPHLDLLTTSQGGLTAEAREVIPLMYENPGIVWLGFKDPSFPVPEVIENLFPHRVSILGIARGRLRHLITQKEARKFGKDFNPWALYKHVSGVNAVKLRKLLSTLEGEDYPANPRGIYRQLRQATLGGTLEVPEIDLEKDLGGYAKVKQRLRQEILDVLAHKDTLTDAAQITALEELIPKGMIFWGPPGTGKTLFAKAMAASIGAAITVISGPELKSKWVGESEERIRQVFHKARQSAPSIIVFDELDSFASARGTYTGSGVEHSMVNQLLTEMDGFHKEEMVFVVGTTNFAEILDPALLRPGRFEFHLHIPYPDADDRRAIVRIYDKKMGLKMTDEAVEHAVKRSGEPVPGAAPGTRYSGDHINALCRAVARIRLRRQRDEGAKAKEVQTIPEDIEQALTEYLELPKMTPSEERVVATHESGHAVCALFCPNSPPIDRISIASDISGALGFVRYQDPTHRYVVTRGELLDDLCVLMGGREAECLLMDDISIGSAGDLRQATGIARALVEEFGLGGDTVGVRRFLEETPDGRPGRGDLSPTQLEALDRRVSELLEEGRQRAAKILKENRVLVETLRDLLLEKKVIDAKTLGELTAGKPVAKRKGRAAPAAEGRAAVTA